MTVWVSEQEEHRKGFEKKINLVQSSPRNSCYGDYQDCRNPFKSVCVCFFFFSCNFSTGKFGACFIPGLCKQSDLTLYASRPGLRLWKADIRGTVQATFILKDVFAGGVKPFELYPRLESCDRGSGSLPEKHLGLVSCFFQEGWVLSWNEYSIYLLDTINQVSEVALPHLNF